MIGCSISLLPSSRLPFPPQPWQESTRDSLLYTWLLGAAGAFLSQMTMPNRAEIEIRSGAASNTPKVSDLFWATIYTATVSRNPLEIVVVVTSAPLLFPIRRSCQASSNLLHFHWASSWELRLFQIHQGHFEAAVALATPGAWKSPLLLQKLLLIHEDLTHPCKLCHTLRVSK